VTSARQPFAPRNEPPGGPPGLADPSAAWITPKRSRPSTPTKKPPAMIVTSCPLSSLSRPRNPGQLRRPGLPDTPPQTKFDPDHPFGAGRELALLGTLPKGGHEGRALSL
jgi:hypothetical protein